MKPKDSATYAKLMRSLFSKKRKNDKTAAVGVSKSKTEPLKNKDEKAS